ncbi:MAG TPA: tetratricopeptide repeat protein, partial [Edaphobacter sp.]
TAQAAASARPAPPPPPTKQQPVTFAAVVPVAPPQKSHRLRKSIVVTFAIIGAVLLTLLIIGLIVGSSQSRVNQMHAGEQAMDARNFDEGITHFKAAIAKHPEMPEAHASLCNAIAFKGEDAPGQKGDYDTAVAECQEAVRLSPDSAVAHSNLCNALNDRAYAARNMGADFDEGIAECRKAIRLDDKNAEAWNNLCNVVGSRSEQKGHKASDHDEAVNACNKAIQLNPNLAAAHKNLGDLYRDSGDDATNHNQPAMAGKLFKEASAEYQQAINLRPAYYFAQVGLGETLYKNLESDNAIKELNKAVETNPNDYVAHFWLGNVYFYAKRDSTNAISEMHRVVELHPTEAFVEGWAEYTLSLAFRAQGDAAEANQHLTRAYNLDSSNKTISTDYARYVASGSSSLGSAPIPASQQSATPAPAAANNSLDGWYFGTTRNVTFHKESKAAIYLEQSGHQLRGCLLVYPPLGGSGPLTGGVDSSAILLQEKTANYTITFSGDVANGRIVGNYVVHWPNLQSELGNMSMAKISQPILAAINVNACPSDADNRAWAS